MADRLLLVLLLPETLEALADRDRALTLLDEPAAVAIEPPRISFGALGRLPELLGSAAAAMQARRMQLPGSPAVVVLLDPLQYPLARALLVRHPDAGLLYVAGRDPAGHRRAADWDRLARARAAAVIDRGGEWAGEVAAHAAAAGIALSRRPSAGAG